jgi:hypothetical protein
MILTVMGGIKDGKKNIGVNVEVKLKLSLFMP